MRDLLRDLNPAWKIIEEQRKLQELWRRPWRDVFDSINLQQTLLSQSLPQVARSFEMQVAMPELDPSVAFSEAVDSIKKMFSGVEFPTIEATRLEASFAEVRHAAEEFGRVLEAMQPPALALGSIVDRWRSAAASFDALQEFHHTFGGELLERLASMEQSESEEEFRDSAALLLEHVENKAGRLAPTVVTWLGLWLTILSIILALYVFSVQQEASELTESRLAEIEKSLVGIGEEFSQHVDLSHDPESADVAGVYITERPANLWAEASTTSAHISKVSPGSLVVALGIHGRWLRVHIFDFIQLEVGQGWLYKRSLREIDVGDVFGPRGLSGLVARTPDIVSGALVFQGTRVPVQALLDHLDAGDSVEEFLVQFPSVTREQVESFVELMSKARSKESDEDPAG